MSWHIPRSLVNELISAQREQLNTGFLLLSLASRGDGETCRQAERGLCKESLLQPGLKLRNLHIFLYICFYPLEPSCV